MTLNKDLSGNNSSNDGNDLSNNDLSNNDLSNNDLSDSDLDLNLDLNLDLSNNDFNDFNDLNDLDPLSNDLLYNDLAKDDVSNNDLLNGVNNMEEILKLIAEITILDEELRNLDKSNKKLNEYHLLLDENNKSNKEKSEEESNEESDKKDTKIKLNIKDKNENKNMNNKNNEKNENKKLKDFLSDLDNKYKNPNININPNINDLLFMNKNKNYKDSGTTMNPNAPSFNPYINLPNKQLLIPLNPNNSNNPNDPKNKEAKERKLMKIEDELSIVKVKKNVDVVINNIEDLITMINNYPIKSNIEYNINMQAMHDIKPDLIELNNMIGMHNLKINIVDQILYFIQDLHINEAKNKKKEEEKKNKKPKPPSLGLKGGIFAGLDLGGAFGSQPETEICTNNSNNDFLHTVIYGPPGTGKTEVAKIMGKIYSKLGILRKGFFKKATRSDFIAGYLGQTAMKTKELIEECLGGVLFIDEAYALGNSEKKDSFAKEALDTLCEALSNHKDDIMVIIAGYEHELNECFFSFNQGLESRFPWRFKTDDYKSDELKLIFKKQVFDNQWKIDDEDLKDEWFESKMATFKHYGRDMETLFSKVKIAHGRRIFCKLDCEKKKLTMEDLDNGYKSYLENENKQQIEHERITKEIHNTLYV